MQVLSVGLVFQGQNSTNNAIRWSAANMGDLPAADRFLFGEAMVEASLSGQ